MAIELLYLPHWLVVYETLHAAVAARQNGDGASGPGDSRPTLEPGGVFASPPTGDGTSSPGGDLPFRRLRGGGAAGEPLAVLVCRLSGQAAHIRPDDLKPAASEITSTSTPDDASIAPRPATLPPALEPGEAEERAADFVSRVLLMAARGKRRRERGRVLRSEPCGYPYWVEYLKRGRHVDFRAVDAVSGKRAGAAVRGAIASGIASGTAAGSPSVYPRCH